MDIFSAIILGIVEGLTEFLPISSTGHLMITSQILGLSRTAFLSTFEIGIQSGAILAIVIYYFKRIFSSRDLFLKVAFGFIPTGVLGLLLYKVVKTYLLESLVVVGWSLLIGGMLIILIERFHKKNDETENSLDTISYKQSFLLGLYQVIAMIPGVSRSGATIMGGLLSGIGRKQIVEFSFLLAIPTILGATGYDLLKTGLNFSNSELLAFAVGTVVSAITAWFAIKFFLRYISNHSFEIFGWYRIIAGALILLFI
ncbi:undecaprenyl-diphosphate phosphatase [Candidatus Parcubacteria bacterium]|nr:undecaprenyl-diphosphate phosphatase [Candidatus Parcubacteria bacterium]